MARALTWALLCLSSLVSPRVLLQKVASCSAQMKGKCARVIVKAVVARCIMQHLNRMIYRSPVQCYTPHGLNVAVT